MIVGHIGGAGSPYEIQKSLRFRASASAYLSRTPGSAGNRRTWTWSGWVKRGQIGASFYDIFAARTGNESTFLRFNGDTFVFMQQNASATLDANYLTTAVYRDPSAWFHVLLSVDTTQATAANRVFLYINGASVPLTASTTIAQNTDTHINRTVAHAFGVQPTQSVGYFDGYLSEINFIDSQALDPSYFGEVSAETGSWIPKKYTRTYGTNGFYLPFNDGSSLANLTADRSGNGNNWTANNISLTSGVTYDWMDDTPSNNFPTWNHLDNLYSSNTTSNGNLTLTSPVGANYAPGKASIQAVGKCYWEIVTGSQSGNSVYALGVIDNVTVNDYFVNQPTAGKAYYYGNNGAIVVGSTVVATGATFADNDVIGFAFDQSAGTLAFYKNNVLQGTATSLSGYTLFPAAGDQTSTGGGYTANINFGQRPFAYSPPAGFKALCTKNLPTPSILNPKKHFDAKTHVGNNATTQITGVQFSPDFAWVKCRSNVTNNVLMDSVRGAGRLLISDSTAGEAGNVGDLITSFNSDGITVNGTFLGSGNASTNGLNYTYVDWLWKAGGAPVTNNAGSIQSQVSANPQAGFSIVTYTGTGANATVGHGLGVAPKLVLVKSRDGTGQPWLVWHSALLGSEYLLLNSTNAKATAATPWNNTVPTSQVFSVGTSASSNELNKNFVAYCFTEIPGYSKIGSYTGNGSTDGPFVYCGFRPKYVMVKRVDTTGNWYALDSTRSGLNVVDDALYADLSNLESVNEPLVANDFVSNGFKVRNSHAGLNASGGSYIFYAVAETPFQFANAR